MNVIGFLAAIFTSGAFLPQVIKAHRSRHTKDLSLAMFLMTATGLTLWIIYGTYLFSLPIIAANSVTLVLNLYLIFLKLRYS